jgi:hypothetical protein
METISQCRLDPRTNIQIDPCPAKNQVVRQTTAHQDSCVLHSSPSRRHLKTEPISKKNLQRRAPLRVVLYEIEIFTSSHTGNAQAEQADKRHLCHRISGRAHDVMTTLEQTILESPGIIGILDTNRTGQTG